MEPSRQPLARCRRRTLPGRSRQSRRCRRCWSDAQMASMATIEFVPPPGLQPWQGAVLLTERINDDTVAAWFSGLVASEAITLSSADGKLVLGLGPKRTLIDPLASQRLDQILKGGESAELGTYDPAFASVWKAVKSEQDTMIKQSGWWTKLAPSSGAGDALSASVLVVVFVLFVLGGASVVSAVLGAFRAVPLALGFGLALPMLAAHAVYRTLLPARSATGSALALRTESFRRFLAASEGQHVDWAYDHGLLREYSAWAVSLGAADAWGKALAASNVPPAEANLSSPLLLYSMGSVFAHSHTAPSSTGSSSGSSGGSSGFSGGSVGGGGGGGSSGSW